MNDYEPIAASRDAMALLPMIPEEKRIFANAVMDLKYDEDEHRPFEPEKLLTPHRRADTNNDLWTTFRVVQENVIRGGVHGYTANGKATTTREVKSIDTNIKLNKALWRLAEEMAALKGHPIAI